MNKITIGEYLMSKIIDGGQKNLHKWSEKLLMITVKNKRLRGEFWLTE
jgi:hypothetical protein